MIAYCRNNLLELKTLLGSLTPNQYQQKLEVLSNGSIGQHIRHILEFYICLIKGKASGFVNYDARQRDLSLESDLSFASKTIDNIMEQLVEETAPEYIHLKGNYANSEGLPLIIGTSYLRELCYCFEHAVHHQAMIKVGLKALQLQNLIQPHFGVAPATQRHKKDLSD
jgi:hypothetical protein